MIVDLDKVANVIAEIAEEEISPRFGKLSAHEIDTKTSASDFVTEADLAAEKKLAIALSDFYPGAVFVGEEIASKDPTLVVSLDRSDGAFWIVDPLDGTRNFVQGREEFGTIVALVVNGEIRNGWIYAIPDQAFALGELGEGAQWNGERLGQLPPAAEMAGYRAIGNMIEPWKSRFIPRLKESFPTEPAQCSAYAYINLVRGEKDFALFSRVNPWDHAAGVLMLGEIGGRAEYLDDSEPYKPVATQGRPLLSAGSVDNWRRVRESLTR